MEPSRNVTRSATWRHDLDPLALLDSKPGEAGEYGEGHDVKLS
jgi:hypothetical protein